MAFESDIHFNRGSEALRRRFNPSEWFTLAGNSKERWGSSFGSTGLLYMVAMYSIGIAVVCAFCWVASAYFGLNIAAGISSFPYDIPLKVPIAAASYPAYTFGDHFFSDYLLPYQWGKAGNPWTDPAIYPDTYPPVLNLIFKLYALLPYRASLWLYQSMSAAAMLSPVFILARRVLRLSVAITLAVLFSVLTTPFVVILDRGNSQWMLVPLLLGIAIAMSRHRWMSVTVLITAAGLVKGYPIFLLLLLVPYRKWRAIIGSLISFVIVNLAVFVVVPGKFDTTVRAFRAALTLFTPNTPAGLLSTNVSLTGCLMNIFEVFHRLNSGIPNWVALHAWTPGILYLILVTPILLARSVVPLWIRLFLAFSTTQLVVPESHTYTTAYMLVVAAIFAVGSVGDVNSTAPFLRSSPGANVRFEAVEPLHVVGPPAVMWVGCVAILATLLPAPWSVDNFDSSLTTVYGPVAVVVFVAVVYVEIFRSLRRRRDTLRAANA